MKVQGRTNNLGSIVSIARVGAVVNVTAPQGTFAKRYFKYLLKKFLKKNQILDYMRVLANSKSGYEIKYRSNQDEEEAEEDEE